MRLLLGLAALAAAVLVIPVSVASFNSRSSNTASIAADSSDRYFHAYSQGADPAGVTGYAIRRGTASTRAATGADDGLTVHLGGWRNRGPEWVDRVLTLKAPATFPPGVTQLTLHSARAADPATGMQPLSDVRFQLMNDTGGGATITLGPGQQVELDVQVTVRRPQFPNGGTQETYVPTVTVWATWPGYADDFFAYVIPVSLYNGNGAG
jgi:hypothetical protein